MMTRASLVVVALAALGGCRSDAPAPAPATPVAGQAAPAPTAPSQVRGGAQGEPTTPADAAPRPAPGADRRALLAQLHRELVCATRGDEAADLMPILQARGYESLSDYARDMDKHTAEDPAWARETLVAADPARCK